ncbi:MAG: thioredoxin family protein [Anaerolineales bacterium]|nr:thioredoxin family protein [Anaerolineales bacterium]
MTKLLNEDIADQVREAFANIQNPVEILYFGQGQDCQYCDETQQLLEEVTALSDHLGLKVYDIQADVDVAQKFNIDKSPGIVIAAKDGDQITDYGVRFAGVPSGHEFTSLIQDILIVSTRDSGLNTQTRTFLKDLTQPVLLQVFVTPTCPYCPSAVILAHKMAMENPLVQAEMVEAIEFPELSNQFGVSGVPQTTINSGRGNVVGAVPEANLVAEIQRALAN